MIVVGIPAHGVFRGSYMAIRPSLFRAAGLLPLSLLPTVFAGSFWVSGDSFPSATAFPP